MPVFGFTREKDGRLWKSLAAERERLYRKPRRWLVHNDTINTNIYGEPGDPITGSDGVTSIPATRRLTSAASDFQTAGVQVSDILEIHDPACTHTDNGRYQIDTVVDANTLEITEDWPVGSLTDLDFMVHFLKERFTEFPQMVPFLVKLEPTRQELTKWGLGEKRDAIFVLSQKVCEDIGLEPKIGDRFIYEYDGSNIHYETQEMKPLDSLGDSGVVMHYVGGARRTTNKLP